MRATVAALLSILICTPALAQERAASDSWQTRTFMAVRAGKADDSARDGLATGLGLGFGQTKGNTGWRLTTYWDRLDVKQRPDRLRADMIFVQPEVFYKIGPIKPYVGAGVGVGFLTMHDNDSSAYGREEDVVYKALIGVGIDVSDSIEAFAELDYTRTKSDKWVDDIDRPTKTLNSFKTFSAGVRAAF